MKSYWKNNNITFASYCGEKISSCVLGIIVPDNDEFHMKLKHNVFVIHLFYHFFIIIIISLISEW